MKKHEYISKALEIISNKNRMTEHIPLIINSEGNAEHYAPETHIPGTEIFYFKHYHGVADLYFFTYEKPSIELITLASAFRSILKEHFGENAEINKNITKSSVIAYFLERQVNRTATQFDAGDVQLLKEGFDQIIHWTKDGTIWTFPWDLIDG